MDLLAILLLTFGALGYLAFKTGSKGISTEDAMTEAAKTLGLQYQRGGLRHDDELLGSIGNHLVNVRRKSSESGALAGSAFVFEVNLHGLAPASLSISSENTLVRWMYGEDVVTGDCGFDENFRVFGERAHVLAALDAEVRRLVQEQVAMGLRLENGMLKLERTGNMAAAYLVETVLVMIQLARALAGTGSIEERLARNAVSDPVSGVRLHNLLVLQEEARGTAIAQQASESALGDTDPEVRLAGAVYLGPAGVGVALAVAEDDRIDEPTRLKALRQVLQYAGRDRALGFARLLVAESSGAVRRCAIDTLGTWRDETSTSRLIGLLGRDPDGPTAQAVASALGNIGDPAAEPALVRLLAHLEPTVAAAAARALGAVGGAGAVEPLQAYRGVTVFGPLRAAARDAIRAIQARLTGAEAGQLSISATTGAEGGLSLAGDDTAGQLSLPEKQPPCESEPQ